tara:strand:- start:5701 stop:5964 length:264 start_codon:yes stop_codon:yes gene_type:complete
MVEELSPLLPALGAPVPAGPGLKDGPPPSMSVEEEKILEALSDGSILSLDELCGHTRLPAPEVMASLTMLELNRSVSRRPDGGYERT